MINVPIEVKVAFDQIESVAQGWHDGIKSYAHFYDILKQTILNVYEAGTKHNVITARIAPEVKESLNNHEVEP